MGADASIFQLVNQQKPQPGPLDNYAQMMSVKQLMGANDLQDLTRTKLTRDMGKEDAFQAEIAKPENQALSVADLMKKLSGIDYSRAATLGKTMLETDVAKANLQKSHLEIEDKAMTAHKNALTNVNDPATAAQWVQSGFADPTLAAIAKRHGVTLESSLQNIPTDPAKFQQWKLQNGLGIEKYTEAIKSKLTPVNLGGKSKMVEENPNAPGFDANVDLTHTLTPGEVQTGTHQKVTEAQGASTLAETRRHHGVVEGVEAVKADPMGILGINKNPSGAAVAGTGLSGDDYLKTLPPGIAQQVRALAEGKLQITPRTLQSPQGAALLQMAMQYEPGTDQTIYQSRAATAKDAASGKLATSNNALNTVTGHLAGLADAADKLDNTRFPWANSIKNAVLSATGDPRVKEFNLNMQGVANELERAYRGAGGSEADIKLWRESLGNTSSPEQFKGVMAKGAEMLQSKLEANHAQYVQGMHGKPGDFKTITPKAEAALNRLRGVKNDAAPAAAATAVTQADIDAEMARRGLKR